MIDRYLIEDILLEYIEEYNMREYYILNYISNPIGDIMDDNNLIFYEIDWGILKYIKFTYHKDNHNVICDIYNRFSKKLNYYQVKYQVRQGKDSFVLGICKFNIIFYV